MTIRHKRVIVFTFNTESDEGAAQMNSLLEQISAYSILDVECASAVGPNIVEVKVVAFDDEIPDAARAVLDTFDPHLKASDLVSDDIPEQAA